MRIVRNLAFLVALLLSASCAPGPGTGAQPTLPTASQQYPVTVTDDAGRTFTFAARPERIVSFTPGHTETLYALGAGARVVVTDKFSDYPPENAPKATLTTYPKPNLEELVSLQPDLLVVLTQGDEFLHAMEARGIPTLKLLPRTFEAALADIELLGDVVGARARAREITAAMRRRAAAVTAKAATAPKVRVFYELDGSDPAKPFAAGSSGFFGDLIPLAGGENVFGDLPRSSGQVSTEQVVARDPEMIILGDADLPYMPQTPEMVKARAGWAQVAAVRAGKVFAIPHAFLERPGPRLVEGLERLAKLLHPELFP